MSAFLLPFVVLVFLSGPLIAAVILTIQLVRRSRT